MKFERYPGVAPFSANQKNIFFGRDNDIEKLNKLITLREQVLLYSKSGMGKTSLLNAGVLPKLPNNLVPVQIRFHTCIHNDNDDNISPAARVLTQFKETILSSEKVQELLGGTTDHKITFDDLPETLIDDITKEEWFINSLWYYFKKVQLAILSHKKNQKVNYYFVLIFDQFEELFSYQTEQINDFKNQLYEITRIDVPDKVMQLIQNKPEIKNSDDIEDLFVKLPVKTVFSIRSDRMDKLNILTDKFPEILTVYHELKPLSNSQAEQAMTEPADKPSTGEESFDSPRFNIDQKAIDYILKKLTNSGEQNLEATQLQIVCNKIEEIAISKVEEERGVADYDEEPIQIELNDIPEFKDIFNEFYYESINKTSQPKEVARFIEDKLIVHGQRVSLDKNIIPEEISTISLNILVNDQHLLRCVPNSVGGVSFELSHDTLIEPILDSKKTRDEIEREKIESKKLLAETERLKKENEIRRLREETQKQKIKQQRKNFVIIITILAIVAVSLATFIVYSHNQRILNAFNHHYSYGIALSFNGKKYAYVNKKGKVLTDYKFDDGEQSFNNFSGTVRNTAFGIIHFIDARDLDSRKGKIKEYKLAQIYSNNITDNSVLEHLEAVEVKWYYSDQNKNIFQERWWNPRVSSNLRGNLINSSINTINLDSFLDELFNNKNLRVLILSNNRIRKLPQKLTALEKLRHLELSNDSLNNLPDDIAKLTDLYHIDISNNQISAAPYEMNKFKKLRYLNISENRLESLPENIGKLRKLIYLNISKNNIERLPESIFTLPNLDFFEFSDNPITFLPKGIGNLTKLSTLKISKTNIQNLPSEIGRLKNLKELIISDNQIKNLPQKIGKLSNLEYFKISEDSLKVLPPEIVSLKNLKYLIVAKSQLTDLPSDMEKLSNLEELVITSSKNLTVDTENLQKLLPKCEITLLLNEEEFNSPSAPQEKSLKFK